MHTEAKRRHPSSFLIPFQALWLGLFLIIAPSASAQRAVATSIVPLFGKVPVPPATAKEASEKAEWKTESRGRVANFDHLFKALEDQATEIATKINTPTGEAAASREEIRKKMNDPEFKKKVKKMPLAEQMKIAQEMNEALGVGQQQIVMEPQSVLDALTISAQVNEETGNDYVEMNKTMHAQLKEQQKDDEAHASIDAWQTSAIDKLPNLSTGEMSYKDPAKVHAVKLQAIDKHLFLVDALLKSEQKKWSDTKARMTKRFGPLDEAIAATHYGNDARNNSNKTALGSAQAQIVAQYTALIGTSKSLYAKGALWYGRKILLLEEKQ